MQEVRANPAYPVTRTPHVELETNIIPGALSRISWGAILAGIFIALITMIALNLLGLSIGANTINPTTEVNPTEGLGTGAVIWLAATTLISMFLGGFVASRLSGVLNDFEGILHGLVAWAVVGLISLALLTSSVGSIINGLSNAIGAGLGAAGQAISEVSPEVAQMLDVQNFTMEGIQNDVRELMRETGNPALQPDAVENQADQAGNIAQSTANQIAQNPTFAMAQVNAAIQRFLNLDAIEETDRQDMVNVLVANTNLTEEEARATLDNWEQAYVQIRADAQETLEQAGQTVADTVAMIAGVLFAALIVGAFAAGLGGLAGVREAEEELENEIEEARVAA